MTIRAPPKFLPARQAKSRQFLQFPDFLHHHDLDFVRRFLANGCVLRIFLTKFWWLEPILEILGFWYRLQNFGKTFVTVVRPYWDQFWKKNILEFCLYHKVTINHRGGIFILIFCQISNFAKFEIWWNCQFWWTSKFGFWQNLEIWHRSPKSNHQFGKISSSAFQRHQNHEIWTNFGPQNQICYIANFAGFRYLWAFRGCVKNYENINYFCNKFNSSDYFFILTNGLFCGVKL